MKNFMFILILAAFSMLYAEVNFDSLEPPLIAQIITFDGTVLYRGKDSFYWQEVKPTSKFYNYDELKTITNSYCEIQFTSGHTVRLDPNSDIILNAIKLDPQKDYFRTVRVMLGKIWIKAITKSPANEQFIIKTAHASISIKGTFFSVEGPEGNISTYEGTVEVATDKQTVQVKKGTEIYINNSGTIQETKPLSNQSLSALNNILNSSLIITQDEKTKIQNEYKKQLEKITASQTSTQEKTGQTDLFSILKKFLKKLKL